MFADAQGFSRSLSGALKMPASDMLAGHWRLDISVGELALRCWQLAGDQHHMPPSKYITHSGEPLGEAAK